MVYHARMSAHILSGTEAARALLDAIAPRVRELDPKLAIVVVGSDSASASYIKRKVKSCEDIGMRSELIELEETATAEELLSVVRRLNDDANVSAYIVQLPLPAHLKELTPHIHKAMNPAKDADGFCAYNLGKMFLSTAFEHLPPATPAGIVALLDHYDITVAGKHAVILGRSNTVGKPLSVMLLNRDATVTCCHSATPDIRDHTLRADIVISAVGKPRFLTADMIKEGAVVIDVGISREDESIVGDVDFEAVSQKASAITPVPGGVGPMTVAALLRNCVRAEEHRLGLI